MEVTRREIGPDGPTLVSAWLPAAYLTAGGLTHAYAITAAKAQGLTADRALVYGNAMDAHVLYPAWVSPRNLERSLMREAVRWSIRGVSLITSFGRVRSGSFGRPGSRSRGWPGSWVSTRARSGIGS